ncbi:uncharacterized protein LOC127863845 [Dreissena polymorpha]|uniref:Uncharacterized protein n=1 Tax=Dreissena polymorpha TaxID=45954 RepID=A0A9D4BD97_DREPO|nr:uncharacterized protein LOC127863845 [Dreissena polymorpha]KAH3690445.1 hypothetical protein DPMN_192072 [Dreissena polymorpha]
MKIVIAIDVITDPDWQNKISYKWFWYLPVTTSTGDQIIEKQPLPPTSSYDKYFKLSLSGKELTFTIPDVKTPVIADKTAEYDLYQDLTDDRLFSINISHNFDHRVVNFTVKGKELDIKNNIEIVKAPNATYDVEPNMTIVIVIDVITDPDWQNQISYNWFWYLPITTSTGDQIIEKQPLPPASSYDKYFKLSLSGKELTFTIPDVKTPVMADNTAEYDLYQDLTDDRLFSINISHNFDHRVVNFTVKGKELDIKKASTSQAHVYIGFGIGIGIGLGVTVAVIIFIKQKRRRHNTPSSPIEDPALTPIDAGRRNQTRSDSILMSSDFEHIADRDVHNSSDFVEEENV